MEHSGEVSRRNDLLGLTPLERFAFAAIGLVLVVSGGVLAAAHLAAHLWGAPPLRSDLVDAAVALSRLPATMGDPAAAWPTESRGALPGPVPYYLSLWLVVAAAVVVVVIGLRLRSRIIRRRHPLGIEPHAGLAGARDLQRLSTEVRSRGVSPSVTSTDDWWRPSLRPAWPWWDPPAAARAPAWPSPPSWSGKDR